MSFSTSSSASSSSSNLDNDIAAATLGCPNAQYNIGLYFHNGSGVSRCYTRALHFFVLSARQGNAKAMHMIGICYKYGEGVEIDNKMAVNWFLFSSSMGNNLSNYEIGYMYYHGYGVDQCYINAEYHLKVGIQNGDMQGIPLYSDTLKKLRAM